MFKPEVAAMEGVIAIELPGGPLAEGKLQVNEQGRIRIELDNDDFAKALFQSGLTGNLIALTLGYAAARPAQTIEVDKDIDRYNESRESWTDGTAAFDARFPTVESFVKRFP